MTTNLLSVIGQLVGALETCRIMAADDQGNYTKEVTPKIIQAALAAAQQALEQGEAVSVDWQDMYWKQKRRAEMWIAKYEKDIGPLEKAHPQATEPAPKGLFIDMIAEHGPEFVAEMAAIGEPAPSPILSSEALRQLDEVMPFRINLVKSGQMASLSVLHECINNVAEEFDLPEHMKPLCIREPAPSTAGERADKIISIPIPASAADLKSDIAELIQSHKYKGLRSIEVLGVFQFLGAEIISGSYS